LDLPQHFSAFVFGLLVLLQLQLGQVEVAVADAGLRARKDNELLEVAVVAVLGFKEDLLVQELVLLQECRILVVFHLFFHWQVRAVCLSCDQTP